MIPQEVIQKYLAQPLIPNGDCWEWTGRRDHHGYGRVRVGRKGKQFLAHRISLFLIQGELNPSLHVCHKCNNPKCVNPSHLYEGTAADNAADRSASGKTAKGDRHGRTVLTSRQVIEVKSRLKSGETQKSIAASFRVRRQVIGDIAAGRCWKHL